MSAYKLLPVALRALEIERETYGPDKGQYKAKVSFDGPNGRIDLTLPHELSLKFLQASSEILAEVSADVARRMHGDVMSSIQQAKALPCAATPIPIT